MNLILKNQIYAALMILLGIFLVGIVPSLTMAQQSTINYKKFCQEYSKQSQDFQKQYRGVYLKNCLKLDQSVAVPPIKQQSQAVPPSSQPSQTAPPSQQAPDSKQDEVKPAQKEPEAQPVKREQSPTPQQPEIKEKEPEPIRTLPELRSPLPGTKKEPLPVFKTQAQAAADLSIAAFKTPASAKAGEDIGKKILLSISNQGSGTALGSAGSLTRGYSVYLVLSRDRLVPVTVAAKVDSSQEDLLLKGGGAVKTPDLEPGGQFAFPTAGVVIPKDTPAGGYYLCVRIDPWNKIKESNERNNLVCRPLSITVPAIRVSTSGPGDAENGDFSTLSPADFVPAQVLVSLQGDDPEAIIRDLERAYGIRAVRSSILRSVQTALVLFEIPPGRQVTDLVRVILADPRVFSSQPNLIYTTQAAEHTDTLASLQYGARLIGADLVHGAATGREVTVAVIDTGVDGEHPDLQGQILERANFAGGVDAGESHGTAIAGVIAARADNELGIYGIAPEAKVLAIRACRQQSPERPEGICTSETLARGLDFAILRKARVINMSIGGPRDPLITRLVDRAHDKGIILVAAAGNNGPEGQPLFPAALENVIAVTATDAKDDLYEFATRGAFIDLAAPGVEIMTTLPAGEFSVLSGTSLAAAHLSGAVALLIEVKPDFSPTALQKLLEQTADDLGEPGKDVMFGSGRLDACRACGQLEDVPLVCE
jgi:type II secretory pathway pseudopilin PulG